jgi:hypothetical protein
MTKRRDRSRPSRVTGAPCRCSFKVVLWLSACHLLPIDVARWASQPIDPDGSRISRKTSGSLDVALTGLAQHLGSQATLLFDLLWITARGTLQEAGQGGFS